MRSKKMLSLFITAAMLVSSLSVTGLNAAAMDENKIDLSDKVLSGGTSYQGKNPYGNAFDGDTSTFFDGDQRSYCQVDLKCVYDISAIRCYPRGGRASDKPSEYVKRMNGSKLYGSVDGENWTELYTFTGLSTSNTDQEALKWYDAQLPETCSYRYIKWQNDTVSANVAEIEIYGTESAVQPDPTEPPPATPEPTEDPLMQNFTILDRSGWTAETNSQQSTSGGNSVGMVLDGNPGTIWHASWTNAANYDPVTNPVYLTVNTGKKQQISGIRYTPRKKDNTAGSINGVITAYEVYISDDNSTWTKIGDGNMGYTKDGEQAAKDIIFAPTEGQYVKMVVKDNLYNGNTYLGSCAEFDLYSYSGDMAEHPINAERAKLDEAIQKLNGLETDHAIKQKLIEKAEMLKISGTLDGIESFISTTGPITDALDWLSRGIDDVYLTRIMTLLSESDISSSALSTANKELAGFYRTGEEAEAQYKDIWQEEFTISEAEKSMPLYNRIESAIQRAKARIDSNDGRDYRMLKELVSYASGKFEYAGYENSFGMSAERCEAIVNNINFALSNLEKIDKGELDTELTAYKSGEIWLDSLGSKISAHGGQIIKQGDTYYWYGEDNKIAYDLTTGVSCYSSKDLRNWVYEGIVFKAFDDGTEAKQFTKEFITDPILGSKGRIERPKVIYNEKNNNYVMWMHLEKDGGYGLSVAGVATAPSPTGPFTWQWYGRPVADTYVQNKESLFQAYRDMNLFVDDDKTAYAFYSSENNRTMYAVRLNDDYTWIDTDGLNIEGSTEADIKAGSLIVPDMTALTNADYTYGKPSFTRYQLASGGAMQLVDKKGADGQTETDENGNKIYVSERGDGRLCIPTYADGRWARVGQNIAEGNDAEGKTETTVKNNTSGNREAPAPIKIGDTYYMVTSALSGWKANPSLTQVTDNILGEWRQTGNPITGDGPANNGQWSQNADRSTSFNSQSTCILQLPDGKYMYMGDRWKNGVYETSNALGTFPDVDVKASTYVWLPITFENDTTHGENTLKVRWADSWSYDAAVLTETVTFTETECIFTVPETETRTLTGFAVAYDENGRLIQVKKTALTAGKTTLAADTDAAYYKAFIWDEKQAPVIDAVIK